MAKTKNITETGPKALRGVRNPDLYPSQSLGLSSAELQGLKDNLARAKYANYNAAHGHLGYQGLNDQSLYTPQIDPNLDYGSSTYDEGVLVDANQQDIDNQRAENQSTLAKAAAGITKGIILAGTTFVDGTAGLLVGLGQGISNALDGDKDTSFSQGFWDNSITKLMGELNNVAEKELVNYRTEEEINGPWYSWDNLTSANFIFDTVIKNMGFTVGAALAGSVYTKAISWGAKAIGLAKLGQSSAATLEAGQKAMQEANATRNTKALVGSFFNAHAEAVQEAYNTSQDFIITSNKAIDSRIAEQKRLAMQEFLNSGGSILEDGSPNPSSDPDALVALNNKLQQINAAGDAAKQEAIKQSKNAGTMDGLMNIPILWASNVAMFGKMYSGGWKSARNATTTTTRATKEAIREARAAAKAGDLTKMQELEALVTKARQTGYQGLTQAEKSLVEEIAPHVLGQKAGVAWAAVKGPLREGNEEMLQGAAAQAAHYRYENEVDKIFDAKIDLDSTYEVRDFIGSALQGFKNQYGDIDNYEEAFVGALTGLLGSPTFGKANNTTDQTYLGKSKWIGLSGGTFTEVRDYLKDRRTADLAAQDATEILRRETLSDDIKHLIAQTKFSDTMDKAIIHDDEKEYKDARTASIFEMVTHLQRVNRLDLLQRAMQATTEFTDEDIAEIANSVSKWVSATTPDVQAKVKQKERVEKDIETILDSYGDIHAEALQTGDPSKIDATDEMLEKKRAELAQLEAEINKAKPVTISPYIHKDGTAFTQEEIKQDINKRVEQFQKIIDTIALAHDQIDNATSGQLTNEQLDTLTWYKVMMNDWNERADGITNQWQELITKLANDPSLVSSVKAIQEVEDLLKEAGLDPKEAKVQFGGRFDQLKKIKNYSNILQQLKEAVEAGGINLAYLLTSTQTVKVKGTNETVGDIISKQMELILQGDTSISQDIKDAFLKNLNDLKSIGKGHRRYNELLDEYLKKPEKIDEAHQASTNRAQAKSSKQNLSNIIDSLDVNSPIGSIAKYLKENTDKIKNAGGFEKFIENLTPEQQEKVRQAQKLVMGLDSLDYLIDQAKLEDEQAQILRNIIDDSIDEANTIEQLAKSIKDSIKEGDVEQLIRDSVPEEQSEELTLQQIEAAEVTLSKFIDDNLEKLAKASDEAERVINEEQEKIKKLAAKTKDPSEDIEREAAKTTDAEKPLEAPSEDDSNKLFESDEVVNPTTSTIARQVNKKNSISPQVGQSGFNRRRQISQYYLQGEDKETLPKHYEEHPEDIPAGVNKDAFLKYIKAVHKKLVESGAYTYISGVNSNLRLKEGQEIRFTTDAKLNEEAGVPVILMVVTDEQGHDQIIGSLPTSLDFQAKKRGSDKTVGETYPEDKALYDTLCEELLSRQSTQQSKTQENLTEAIEKLSRIEKALASSDVKLWSDNPWDNVTLTTTHNGFNKPIEKSRLTASASDYRDALKGKVGDTVRDKAKIVFRDRHGNTYIEVLNAKDGKVKSAIVFPVGGRAGDNYTVYFYKTFTPDERDIIISYIQEHKNDKDLVKILNTLLQHSNDNLIYLRYRDPNKLAEARQKAQVQDKSENTIDVNTLKPGDIVKFQGTNIKITKVEENILYGDMGGSEVEIKKSQFDQLTPFQSTEQKAEENQKVSNITTKVEALRGGHPSFSSQNRSVSEVFGDNPIPITIILTKGPKSSSAVKNPVNVAQPIDGQVYVYVTSNTGVQKPLLCFSTPLRDLANNDWYIEQTIQAVQNLSEAINLGSSKSNLLRWLPFLNNLHVNIQDRNGTKFVLLGWGENKKGEFTNTYSIRIQEDGTISSKDALSFIKTISGRKITTATGEKIYPTTNVDRKQINNEEYLKNISRYIKVNITSDSPRTIDDWFTYEPTELQKRGEKPSSVNLAVLSSGKQKPQQTVQTSKGEATVSSAGTVTIEGDKELTKAEEKAILKEASKEASKGEDISDIVKESKGSILATAFGARSISNDEMPDTSRRRRRRRPANGDTKFSLVSQSEPQYTSEMQSIEGQLASSQEIEKNLEKVAAMFPKLAKEGRIVLVKGLIDVVDKKGNPRKAYGMFRNGVLYISDQSPKGTAFHEAFHYIADTLLTDAEQEIMFDEATKIWGDLSDLELEENLSEAFREFMNEREDHSIKGKLNNIFQKLKHIILSIVGRENYLDSLFWSIYRNKMQDRVDNTSEDTFKQELLRYKAEKLKYSDLDQETKDYLSARKFSEENYEKLSIEQKEILLSCM